MKIIFLAFLFLILGCAGRTYEADSKDPSYHSGEHSPFTLSGHGADTGFAAAAVSATMLAGNPKYYEGTVLKGKLLCGPESTPSLQSPCPRTTVILKNTQGKTLTQTITENGEFTFQVAAKQEYLLTIDSKAYEPTQTKALKYQQGDTALLHLRKKR